MFNLTKFKIPTLGQQCCFIGVKMKITGTFLDEITHDIPSSNWGVEEWARDFDAMKSVGIDTVILIRGGYSDHATFDSVSLKKYVPLRPVYTDLVDLFLSQAERCGMDFFMGTYDPFLVSHQRDYDVELKINLDFISEVVDRYGDRKAFKGWYLSREISTYDPSFTGLFEGLCSHMKTMKDIPVLVSPSIYGKKQFANPITPEEHEKHWRNIYSRFSGYVDIVAFQDGHVDFGDLPLYMQINTSLARENGIIPWSNVETFERGMPIDFLPIAWPHLRDKIETAARGGVEKLITFEFSHFLSPNSVYPSAHNLFKRYCEWFKSTEGLERGKVTPVRRAEKIFSQGIV